MTAPVLDAQGLTLSRGGARILDGVDCTVEAGSLTALVGPNGAGKSTLLHLIAGAEQPSSGVVRLDGQDVAGLRRRARARRTALVEQQAETDLDLSVFDVVMLGRTPHTPLLGVPGPADELIALDALHTVGADALVDRRFHELSGGERQRVLLARALAQQPQVLLIDEPTNHLDIEAQLATLAALRALADSGIAVLAALHDLTLAARFADRVVMLDHGRLVATGLPLEVLTPGRLREVYRVRADIVPHPVDGTPLIVFAPAGTGQDRATVFSVDSAG
ncbi:ABC transporter ATP-binding protein [Microbacterium soli]|uniref:ABC transporter ATP-binding protein n=1 Tax=Microbacterium soli TaxID=446075 RepID=A0ABP7N6F5_9MICO